ncbi:MAG: HNH endonuclease family protein [Gordonia sp. (in: high G+C Gram-positive bacteria)]
MTSGYALLRYRIRAFVRHRRSVRWPPRRWAVLIACVVTAVSVAIGTVSESRDGMDHHDGGRRTRAAGLLHTLAGVAVLDARVHRDDYQRSAFGPSWSDDTSVADSGNGCDTRNDILARDLADTRRGPVASCPHAILAGELHSPYTGQLVVFRRDRRAAAVQIDHIVPLAFAWDMGAYGWSPQRRADLANDPANLVAVDAHSNQDKSDSEPGRWMPPDTGFHCQYATEFVMVVAAYQLSIDRRSRDVLAAALGRCR